MTETGAPTGYQIDNTSAVAANVSANSTCGDGNELLRSFTDTPLTTITVSTTSLAGAGVTTSTAACAGDTATATPHTTTGLVPGTYTCTVVIDP